MADVAAGQDWCRSGGDFAVVLGVAVHASGVSMDAIRAGTTSIRMRICRIRR
jgi:hypothetical protein